ncbi:MAG TPA: hypothetical protein VE644_13065 [Gaiellaceae bacterium]|jgi:hypothetical protein|nr:hypothetical protein [Gaiellaceae bacterium]
MTAVVLGPGELVHERPFTDPAHTEREADLMREALSELRARAGGWTGEDRRGVVLRERDEDGHRHLIVVPDTRALLEADGLTAVGFFGHPRAGVDHGVLFTLEDELVAGMEAYADAGLLTYYDVELPKSHYGNLVLFSTPDVPPEWVANAVHRRAIEISPEHYYDVRLHKGAVTGRLLEGGRLTIERTKYFDFAGEEEWRALRRFG